ncbi:MAG TPA: acyloxyacyl hydrolase, partial [Flavisolibacter sp.]|nr:acyloxyacyl hydrolase [Flavisolibacter sp.]
PLDIEFGTNIGIRYYQKLNEKFYLYQMIGSGPHFITGEVSRQAKGFIFSDNIGVGVLHQINKQDLFINFQAQFRHVSNAGLKRPNGGINTYNFLIGVSKLK